MDRAAEWLPGPGGSLPACRRNPTSHVIDINNDDDDGDQYSLKQTIAIATTALLYLMFRHFLFVCWFCYGRDELYLSLVIFFVFFSPPTRSD